MMFSRNIEKMPLSQLMNMLMDSERFGDLSAVRLLKRLVREKQQTNPNVLGSRMERVSK